MALRAAYAASATTMFPGRFRMTYRFPWFFRLCPCGHALMPVTGGAAILGNRGRTARRRRAKSNVIARPGKTTCPDLAPPTDPPLEAPPGAARTTRLDHLGFPKCESPLRQLPDERGEVRRCPFRHVHENVVLRFVRLLEELVLDIRILFSTGAPASPSPLNLYPR